MKKNCIKLCVLSLFCFVFSTVFYSCESAESYYKVTLPKKTGFSGESLDTTVKIVRDKVTRSVTITIAEDGEWEVYAGTHGDSINMSVPVLTGSVGGTYTITVPAAQRLYFQVITDNGSAIMAERVLPMTGAYNMRDLGGYKTTDGRYVKWGKILRAEALSGLTPADLEYLGNLPLVSVADFRGPGEGAADKLPATAVNLYPLSLTITGLASMEGLYRDLVTVDRLVEQYRKLFECLMDEEKVPLLYHCSAGKDRTGVASALILFALGVDEETIFEDFMLTNTCFSGVSTWTVERSWLEAMIETVRNTYGAMDNFLTGGLGVDIEAFRDMYLY